MNDHSMFAIERARNLAISQSFAQGGRAGANNPMTKFPESVLLTISNTALVPHSVVALLILAAMTFSDQTTKTRRNIPSHKPRVRKDPIIERMVCYANPNLRMITHFSIPPLMIRIGP